MSRNRIYESQLSRNLLSALAEIDRPGEFATSGDYPLTMPGLDVNFLGQIPLPLPPVLARKLIEGCEQAPYGKGTDTLIDTDVRHTWELDPKKFYLRNPEWDEVVETIVQQVQNDLGLGRRKLEAHLYKLLVYEEGSFFLPHQDGEKIDGMVATLSIVLPAEHEGGELIVRHDGWEQEITFDEAASGYGLCYAAFYADCEHEILPIQSGYRLCLTYNLVLATGGRKKNLLAPCHSGVAEALEEALGAFETSEDMSKMVVVLEHQYTRHGLTLDALKGVDRARAEALFLAAEQTGFAAHLALLTRWEFGSADGGPSGPNGGHEMCEVIDYSQTLDSWSDREGKRVQLGKIDALDREIIIKQTFRESEADQEDFEGFTGNAGMTLGRWYHRAAIVLWPSSNHLSILCEAGTEFAIKSLKKMVGKLRRTAKSRREDERRRCLLLAEEIVETWGLVRRETISHDEGVRGIFIQLLFELDDPNLVCEFLSEVLNEDASLKLGKDFLLFCRRHGWSRFASSLKTLFETKKPEQMTRNAAVLRLICRAKDKDEERKKLARQLANQAIESLKKFDNEKNRNNWVIGGHLDRGKILASLVAATLALEAAAPLTNLVKHAISKPKKYDLIEVHLAAIFSIKSCFKNVGANRKGLSLWLNHARDELRVRTRTAPQEPQDYRRSRKFDCSCADCRSLKEFLADPRAAEFVFKAGANRRAHLEDKIQVNKLDCRCKTRIRSRPYSLVCTKTTASFARRSNVYVCDLERLSKLEPLLEDV